MDRTEFLKIKFHSVKKLSFKRTFCMEYGNQTNSLCPFDIKNCNTDGKVG